MRIDAFSWHARAPGNAATSDGAPRSKTALAFALPLFAALLADAVAELPGANAPSVFAMFEAFALSMVAAALLLASAAARWRAPLPSRRIAIALGFSMLVFEGWGLSAWLFRGLHG